MGRVDRSLAGRIGRGARIDRVDQSVRRRPTGSYPNAERGLGYGATAYPSVLEQYNRSSDYRRWKLGQDYYYSTGRGWADYQSYSLARFITGAVDGTSKDIVTAFPSTSSPEKAWYVGLRTRGSIMLPAPITADRITLAASDPDPANHRLIYNVSGILSSAQLQVWRIFIGDPFEDTGSGPSYPDELIEKPVGSVQLTLVDVQVGAGNLVFDLSRPQTRVARTGRNGLRVYQSAPTYEPSDPLVFDTSGSRHLVSSFKFFCCCPDCLGGALANLEMPADGGDLGRMPLPNAARVVRSAWERQGTGYYRQWRTLPERMDERRECKHIHALRWQCGVPWLEPDDYPTADERQLLELESFLERRGDSAEARRYFQLRQLNWDRYVMSLAEVVGLQLFPGSDVRNAVRPDGRPLLWNDGDQPLAIWCRQNDWWLERGTQRLRIFNSASQRFEQTVTAGGISYPMVQEVEPGSPGAPVIVP